MTILLINCTILPMTGDTAELMTGAVGIENNRITLVSEDPIAIAAFQHAHPDARLLDGTGKLLMPGLINTHCHAAMTLQRGYADDMSLMRWLNDYIWPFESRQTFDEIALGAELGMVELLLGGATSFVDMYHHEDRCVEVAQRMGIRAMLGCNYFDHNIEEVIPQIEAAIEKAASCSRIQIAVAPHSGYTCSPENLLRGKALCAKYNLHCMTHIAETKDESRMIRERYGCSPVEHLDALGLLDQKTIGAHCIYVSDGDIEILRMRGVAVSHNPQSNMKIASGVAPVVQMMACHLPITIGTDGTCSNNDLDMWEEMRSASFLQKSATGDPCALPAYEALKMVTVHGARALGYAGELGIIAPGALADVILVDLQKPHLQPIHNLVANLVYCGKASDVDTVIVDGDILVEGRRLLHSDLPQLYARVAHAVRRITSAVQQESREKR